MPATIIGTVTIWMVALMVPAANHDATKLAVHEFDSQAECEVNIPYLKRYYRLYGERWTSKCVKSRRLLPANTLNYGSM